ncbi:MAG TPA: protein kinase [Candidatus Acidoferrum sp.]|jgi:serine/threonine protein kinase/WD40 repeat protein|nr:protein kinase [Candidatus Acidoferrum sp.]
MSDSRSRVGHTVSHYRIVDKLGSGGMGIVYRAEDVKLGRVVALKFLSEQISEDPQSLDRFYREARAISTLNHPSICTIYEIDESDGQPFIAMELLEGRGLDAEMQGKPVALERLLNVGIQLSAGLEAAHSKGIVHRDIKPANLFVNSQGQLKILDFGLAKPAPQNVDDVSDAKTLGVTALAMRPENLTSPGIAVGTVAYMSPEQAKGEHIDTRSDLFSAGSVLYELAVGVHPFAGKTSAMVYDAILNREPIPPNAVNPALAPEVGRIIEKCLEKDRDVRYQHAGDLGADLKRLSRDLTPGKQTRLGPQEEKSQDGAVTGATMSNAAATKPGSSAILSAVREHRIGTAAVLMVVLVLVVAAVYGIYEFARSRKHSVFENYAVSQVTDFGDVENAAISPDGKYLAFVRSGTGKGRNLWLRQLSTNNDTQVVPAIEPVHALSFSPDQSYIYYRTPQPGNREQNDLYRVPIFGGKPQIVVQNLDSEISFVNDGRELCFSRSAGDPENLDFEIILRDSKTGAESKSLRGAGTPYPLVCNPDGTIAIMAFLKAFGQTQNNMSVARLPNGTLTPLVKFEQQDVVIGSIAPLPYQPGVIFTQMTLPGFHHAQLFQVDYPGGSERRITNDLNDYGAVALSSDGKILSSLKREVLTSLQIWGSEHPENVKIADNVKDPLYFWWSGSDQVLVNTQGMELKMANLTSAETSSIHTDPAHTHWQPSLCGPDDVVASGTASADGSWGVWKLNLTTGVYKQLTSGSADFYPQCTADGKWVVYYEGAHRRLMRVPTYGGSPVQIRDNSGWFDLSPDGTKLVDLFTDAQDANGMTDPVLHLISTKDWKEVWTARMGTTLSIRNMVRFMPDRRGALFEAVVDGKMNLWVFPFDGGAPRQFTHYDDTAGIEDYHWSPDGKKLGIIRVKRSADAVIFRDVKK